MNIMAVGVLVIFLIAMTQYFTDTTSRKGISFSLQFHGGKSVVVQSSTDISWVCQEPEASCSSLSANKEEDRDMSLQGLTLQ